MKYIPVSHSHCLNVEVETMTGSTVIHHYARKTAGEANHNYNIRWKAWQNVGGMQLVDMLMNYFNSVQ